MVKTTLAMTFALLLGGCKFEAERDILAGEPSQSPDAVFASLPATRFEEVGGTRSISIRMTPDGLLELTLFDDGVQQQQVRLHAVYAVPGPANARLGAELTDSGRVHYYLLRSHADGQIEYVDVDTRIHDDPRVLLYRAHLWALGIPQRLKVVDFGNESGMFRPATQSEADFDAALTARQEQRLAANERSDRQACLRMMADCPLANTVCVVEGDETIINTVDGRFWYSRATGALEGASGVGLLGSGRKNCAIRKLVD